MPNPLAVALDRGCRVIADAGDVVEVEQQAQVLRMLRAGGFDQLDGGVWRRREEAGVLDCVDRLEQELQSVRGGEWRERTQCRDDRGALARLRHAGQRAADEQVEV